MILDANQYKQDDSKTWDYCIIGAGTTGLILAEELAKTGAQVILLESGGLKPRPDTTALDTNESVGDRIDFSYSIARYFGGKSETWMGRLRTMDSIDLEDKPWAPFSGWPISESEIQSYYKKAAEKLGFFKPLTSFNEEAVSDFLPKKHLALYENSPFELVPFWFAPKIAFFGTQMLPTIKSNSDILCLLNANVSDLVESPQEPSIQSALVTHTETKKKLNIKAKQYVLAAGGIEIPRIMLSSRSKSDAGVGNKNGLVGRFFGGHPLGIHGLVHLNQPIQQPHHLVSYYYDKEGNRLRIGLRLRESEQRKRKQLNHLLMFTPVDYLSFNRFKKLAGRPHRHHDTLVRLGLKPASATFGLGAFFWNRLMPSSKRIPSSTSILYITSLMDQVPNSNSRIELIDATDRLGNQKCRVHWEITKKDEDTLIETYEILRGLFESNGLGIVESKLFKNYENWNIFTGSSHFHGATRMHPDPRQGVVDPNLKVHGLENLYITGPSVFSTAGYANPMLTILALNYRLSKYLVALDHKSSSCQVS